MKKILLLSFCILSCWLGGNSQNVATGSWDIHLSYGNGTIACEGDGYVYVGNTSGFYSINQDNLTLKRYSTVNGLSDVGVSAMGYSTEAKCLIICYANGNIDLMKGDEIINIKDIINASSIIFKKILNVTIKGKLAYLASEFGIAVVDLEKEEVPSYVIFATTAGFEMAVRQVAVSNDGTIIAASDAGLFRYSGLGAFQDFGAWVRYPDVFLGTYNAVVNHNGELYASYSRYLSNGLDNQDTIYKYNGTYWQAWDTIVGRTVRSMDVQNGKLSILLSPVTGYTGTLVVKNADGTNHAYLHDDFLAQGVNAFTDSKGVSWVTHSSLGVIRVWNFNERNFYYPDGPFASGSYRMKHNGKYLWVATGGTTNTFNNLYRVDGVLRLSNENKWDYFNLVSQPMMSNSYDYLDIALTENEDVVYTVANSGAVYQISGNTVPSKFDSSNTNGALIKPPLYSNVMGASLSLDNNGALWMGMCYSGKPLAVKKADGTWKSFTIPGITLTDAVNVVTALDNGQIWLSVRGKGIFAIKHDNYNNIIQVKNINTNTGSGELPSPYVHCITQDKDGEVWVGTETGFSIFYNPEAVFGNTGFNGVTPVVVANDGNNEKLLDGVFVRDIYVDGGNRKWMATYGAGAYLLSADGYTIQKHFLKSNSPLLSDNLLSVTGHPHQGNIYFGTDLGIISYRSDATQADDNFSENVFAFPNPVRPENTGPVTISGLAQNAQIKITDISGQLIYQTQANGGTAIWNANSFGGKRAQTGVYLVFAASEDGSQKEVTRILIIN